MKLITDLKSMGNSILLQTNYPLSLQDGKYVVEIKEFKKNRSLNQNAMLWGIINEISKKECGSFKESERVYEQLLQMAGVRSEIVSIPIESVEKFQGIVQEHSRVLKKYWDTHTNEGRALVEVYCGSSNMDTKEMSHLIDVALDWAIEIGINTSYWESLLNVK